MIRKRYVYMIVNQFGQPLFTRKNRYDAGTGQLWFFTTKANAIKHIESRNKMKLDLDKKRIIVRLDWGAVYKLCQKAWEQQ